MEGALPPGHMVNGLGKQQNRLSGRCPDLEPCSLPVWCSGLCWRLEATEIAELLRAEAVLAGGRKVT